MEQVTELTDQFMTFTLSYDQDILVAKMEPESHVNNLRNKHGQQFDSIFQHHFFNYNFE